MKLFIPFFILTSILISCNDDSEKKNDNIQVSTKNIVVDETPKEINEVINDKNKIGEVITYFSNGNIDTEGWNDKDGERDKTWYSYYENGLKWSEQSYNHGLKHGRSVVYYPNGKMHYEGEYTDDKKSGHWTFYSEDGEIETEKDY